MIVHARGDDRVVAGEGAGHVLGRFTSAEPDLVLLDGDGWAPSWTAAISIELRVRALGFSK
jgi:hypothetical protein